MRSGGSPRRCSWSTATRTASRPRTPPSSSRCSAAACATPGGTAPDGRRPGWPSCPGAPTTTSPRAPSSRWSSTGSSADRVPGCCRRTRSAETMRHDRELPHRPRSEEHTSELQSRQYLVCRLLLEKKKTQDNGHFESLRDLSLVDLMLHDLVRVRPLPDAIRRHLIYLAHIRHFLFNILVCISPIFL